MKENYKKMTKEELEKENAELKEKISGLLSCKNCPENKGGWICAKEYENKCLTQKIEFIKELEEEKCELLGIIQGKDKVIQELKKENANLKALRKYELNVAKLEIEKLEQRNAELKSQIEKMKFDVLSLIKDGMNDDIDQNIIERLVERW